MYNFMDFIKNNKFNIIILFCYLLITIVVMFYHEIWRDEAQVWCLVRDCNILEILNNVKYEGHPILWYILVFPFAKSGMGVLSMQILSLTFVFLAVLFLLFKSPFNKFQKVIISFSAGMLYYLPIIARNYALIPLILFLIAKYWQDRNKHPYLFSILIILLSNTHIYMFGCAFCIFCIFIYEKIKDFIKYKQIKKMFPCLIVFLNFITIFLFFYNTQNQNYALEVQGKTYQNIGGLLLFISQVYIYPIVNFIKPLIKYFNILSIILFFPFLGLILYRMFCIDKKIFIVLTSSIGFVIAMFYYIYLNGIIYQKIFLIFLLILFGIWIVNQEKRDKWLNIAFNTLFIISCLVSPFAVISDIKYNFSGGKQIAQYINKNLNNEDTFIAFGNPYLYSSISAYLPDKKFYNVITNSYISYFSFKTSYIKKSPMPENNQYFIIQDNIKRLDEMGFKILFESDKENISSKDEQEIFKICLSQKNLFEE